MVYFYRSKGENTPAVRKTHFFLDDCTSSNYFSFWWWIDKNDINFAQNCSIFTKFQDFLKSTNLRQIEQFSKIICSGKKVFSIDLQCKTHFWENPGFRAIFAQNEHILLEIEYFFMMTGRQLNFIKILIWGYYFIKLITKMCFQIKNRHLFISRCKFYWHRTLHIILMGVFWFDGGV